MVREKHFKKHKVVKALREGDGLQAHLGLCSELGSYHCVFSATASLGN
jgi:hypothetical protein